MSGFLHRLAGTVLRPQQRIYPLVGSLYASHPLEPEIGPVAGETNTPQSSPLLPRDSSPHERHAVSKTSVGEQDKNPVAARVERVEPAALELQDRHPQGTPPAAREDSAQRESIAKAQPNTPLLGTPAVLSTCEIPAEAQKSLYSVPELSVGRGNRGLVPNASPGPMPHSARSERRKPDEIQIHIGRIEVTAVPQTPPSTPARPGRTAPTLAEYLHRRDGRAG